MSQKALQDKVVVITGGSSGIGKACAEVFGKAGAKIVITGRNKENLVKVSGTLNMEHIDNFPIVADSSIEADCEKVIRETVSKYQKIDILINNAGISMRALFQDRESNAYQFFWNGLYYQICPPLPHRESRLHCRCFFYCWVQGATCPYRILGV